MDALRDLLQANPGLWLGVGGGVLGFLFGALVAKTNFCTMGSLSDIANFGDYRRFRAWILAATIALIGTQALALSGAIPLTKTMYLAPNLNWLGHILGGLLFGFGMVYAGGCASRNLARVGQGDFRALVTLVVMGIFAYMSIGGIIGPARAALETATSIPLGGPQGLGETIGRAAKLSTTTASLALTAIIALAGLAYTFGNAKFRSSAPHVLAGVGIGLIVTAGWALTGLAFDELADKPVSPISLTYVRPTADTLEWLQRYTAARVPGFGVTSVIGAILGAFAVALATKRFRLQTYSDLGDTKRNLLGAALMGIGGVLALGCTVGQAITGVSTLAIGSFLTFASIIAGGRLGLISLERAISKDL
ncbi:MAG: hypothetical protein RL291_1023 [Pseudomonadota bacterium]